MPKVVTFDKGSKRRLKQIRWKISEIITLALAALLALVVTALAVLWEIHHTHPYSEPPKAPQIKETQPRDP